MIDDAIQVGDGSNAIGNYDIDGRRHGLWYWDNPIEYEIEVKKKLLPGATVPSKERYPTTIRMSIWYDHGKITKAVLDYDITDKASRTWEEGRAVGTDEYTIGYPFKKGIWRVYHGENGRLFSVRKYDGVSILWCFQQNDPDAIVWVFKRAILTEEGFFKGWSKDIGVAETRLPPDDVWDDWEPSIGS